MEAQAALGGELFLDVAANGRPAARRGNRRQDGARSIPCAGDRWLAIAIASDAEWDGLRAAMGHPAWADDRRFATVAGHLKQTPTNWTTTGRLDQRTGPPRRDAAAPGARRTGRGGARRPRAGDGSAPARPRLLGVGGARAVHRHRAQAVSRRWRFSASRRGARRPAPTLGEHSEQVLRETLSYDADRIAAISAAGALGQVAGPLPPANPVSLAILERNGRIRALDADYRAHVAATAVGHRGGGERRP
ncbi:MAG: CoA transferase [Dehalococcoidia bacterium]